MITPENQEKTQHSPLPWKTSAWGEIKTPEGETLLVNGVSLPYRNHPKDAEATANAQYIIRACNAFPDLLAALESAVAQHQIRCDIAIRLGQQPPNSERWVLSARAAIAAAKAP